MGLKTLSICSLLFLSTSSLFAAPTLRLASTVVGPVSITQGANGTTREIEAYNAGDGSLSLTFSSSATWAAATAGASRPCTTRSGNCIPVQIAYNTAPLAAGIYTATITVKDPNAVDAPQSITVIAQMGGGVPSQINLFVAPNGSSDSTVFKTNSPLTLTPATQSGGNWLSLAVEAEGSFAFVMPYRVTGKHLNGMAEGTYNGTLGTSGSAIPAENKTVNITLRVTSQPIVALAPESVFFRIAENTKAQTGYIQVANRGLGTLNITGVTASVTGTGTWLTASQVTGQNLIQVKADPTGLAVGSYAGKITIATNGVTSSLDVPVSVDVVAQANPTVAFGGILENANFIDDGIAPGGIVAVFGDQLTFEDAASAPAIPLATTLAKAAVFINNVQAPLYFASYNQINFQVPYNTATGTAIVRVERDGVKSNNVSVQVKSAAPRLMKYAGYGIVVNQNGTLNLPRSLGGQPAKRGDTLVIYGLGFGQTNPPATSGAAAPGNPLAWILPTPKMQFAFSGIAPGIEVAPGYMGLTPGLVGLYQINVVIPDGVPNGVVPLRISGFAEDFINIVVE